MAIERSTGRSILASAVGYVIAAIVIIWLLGAVIGAVLWLVRTVIVVAVVLGLVALYLKLKTPKSV